MSRYLGQLKYYNVIRRIFIFLRFFVDNIQNSEYYLIFISIKYLLLKRTHSKDLIIKTNIGRFEIRAESTDFITVNSAYEYWVMKALKNELTACDLFLDIGANVGTYSIYTAKNKIKTIAFEPIKANFDSLIKNIELNELNSHVDAFNLGISNVTEERKFYFNKRNTGASSLYKLKSNANGGKCDVSLLVFDDFKNEHITNSKCPLIKIDVEGMEIDVLEGMKRFITEKESLKLIIESKHAGEDRIKQKLLSYGDFSFRSIDAYNLLAIKTKK